MTASDLDDICPVIGYRATRILAAWFAGRRLHVPCRPSMDHPLHTLIGPSALAALVKEFAGYVVWVPTLHEEDRFRRDRQIAEWFAVGWTADRVAAQTGITQRRVEQIRNELIERKWLQYAEGKLRTGEVFGEPPPRA